MKVLQKAMYNKPEQYIWANNILWLVITEACGCHL